MTESEYSERYVRAGLVDADAPVYLNTFTELRRVRWIAARRRLQLVLRFFGVQGGGCRYDVRRAAAILSFFWEFPVGRSR